MRLSTPRLLIRDVTQQDVAPLTELWTDAEVTRHMGGPRTPAFMAEALNEDIGVLYDRDALWPVEQRSDGLIIGHCGLLDKEVEEQLELELTYVISKHAWGNGYATEAGKALCTYAFETLRVKRLIALIAPENAASERVAQRLGFSFERDVARAGSTMRRLYALEP